MKRLIVNFLKSYQHPGRLPKTQGRTNKNEEQTRTGIVMSVRTGIVMSVGLHVGFVTRLTPKESTPREFPNLPARLVVKLVSTAIKDAEAETARQMSAELVRHQATIPGLGSITESSMVEEKPIVILLLVAGHRTISRLR